MNSKRKNILIVFLSIFIISNLLGKAYKVEAFEREKKIKIAVTTNQLKEFSERIGGKNVEVQNIIPSNIKAKEFQMKISDYEELFKCDMFVYNGLELEPWYDEMLKSSLVDYDVKSILSSMNVNSIGNKFNKNPYSWLSLQESKKQAEEIKKALVKYDSKNASYYEKNYNKLVSDIDTVINEYTSKLQQISNKEFITGYNQFAYLARDFGLINNIVRGNSETNSKGIISDELVKYCIEKNVKVVFEAEGEELQLANELANKINAKVEELYTIEGDIQSMTYIEAMKYNLETIYRALL